MATQRLKITQAACEKTPPNSKLWDTEIKGFGLFAGKTTKTFYYQREVRGKTVRIKLGNFPQVSAGIARGDVLQLAADHASSLGKRWLQGCYAHTDALYSKLAVLQAAQLEAAE